MAIPPRPGWYEPPKPEKNGQYSRELYIALTVVLVVVSISVVLFAYFAIPEPYDGYFDPTPNVQFSAAEASGPNEWIVQVAGVSDTWGYDSFRAVLLRNGVVQGEVMNPLQITTVGNITFTDIDGGGRLSVGDWFTITTWPGGTYKLSVVSRDSENERGFEEWET